ncbi:Uu.00g121480.m01.CDS01 [Anthostomella pinea]|uniref:Uu.00g121480.m01.CDS01 n=1 Tax=Anthostomella pinea TaxID=933095 RepID=A0AAI8YHB0_9PEZI|nr:Uu.00g121480.m01.CDS01 [Anthostomella pinea]
MERRTSLSHDVVEKQVGDVYPATHSVPAEDALLVTWDSPSDPQNPKNWPKARKWFTTILLSLGSLVTLMSGAMLAPALGDISASLHLSQAEAQLSLSIYVLAFAFGPLLLGPCSEIFGRKPVWVLSSAWYVVWNLGCGFANGKAAMIAGRLFAGLGASADFAISNPVLADCFPPDERGQSFAIASFIPLLGPALGPIVGGAITETIGWRWLFWVLSVFEGLLVILAILLLRESHAPTILRRKAKGLRKATGRVYYTEFDVARLGLGERLRIGLVRPFHLLVQEPIIQVMAVLLAYNFGVLYIVLSTFADLWIDIYHDSPALSGVRYLALVVGYTMAAQLGGRVTDRVWNHLKRKRNGEAAPEYRVPLMLPGVILIPAGLIWYGWSAEKHLHWAMTEVGAAIFGCGIIVGTQAMQAYVLDSFAEYSASAQAAAQFLRNCFAFVFPIFAPAMYTRLGYGWGNSLLAFLFLAIGVPAPVVLWKYGAKLRGMGRRGN